MSRPLEALLGRLDELPPSEQASLLQQILDGLPAQGDGPEARLRDLAERVLEGEALEGAVLVEALVEVYDAYADMLEEVAEQAAPSDELLARASRTGADGYRKLAQGVAEGDPERARQGLEEIAWCQEMMWEREDPTRASAILSRAFRQLLAGTLSADEVAATLDRLELCLDQNLHASGADPTEEADPLVQAWHGYAGSLDLAWSALESGEAAAARQAASWMREAEGLLYQVIEESDQELERRAGLDQLLRRFGVRTSL